MSRRNRTDAEAKASPLPSVASQTVDQIHNGYEHPRGAQIQEVHGSHEEVVQPEPAPPPERYNPPTHKDDPLLSPTDVGRQLGKSPQTISRWIQDGLLKAIPLPGGRVAVRKSEVNKFLGGSALQRQLT